MPANWKKLYVRGYRLSPAWGVLVVGIAIAVLAWSIAESRGRRYAIAKVDAAITQARDAIRARVDSSFDVVYGLQALFHPTLTLCLGLSGLLVLWFGGRDVISGRLTLGEFVAFTRYLVLLSWPLIAFGWVINLVQRGVASWERMLEVFDAPVTDTRRPGLQTTRRPGLQISRRPGLQTRRPTREPPWFLAAPWSSDPKAP